MLKCNPHRYGPKSLLAAAVRCHMAEYREEARRAQKDGRPMARRACLNYALMLRADFRNSRLAGE